jgi:hypothetical protein
VRRLNATFPKISESRPEQYDALTPFTDDLEHARILKPSLHLCLWRRKYALKVIKIYGGFF